MKTLLIIPALLILNGCMKDGQILDKSTVFGLQAVSPGSPSGQIKIQIGLVRNEFIYNPTAAGTNVYAAPLTTHVDAKLSPINQSAIEDISSK